MQLKSISIQNFKKFTNAYFEFKDGLNVIIGPNEAGKSTLIQAILSSIYGEPNTKSRSFYDEVAPWSTNNLKSLPVLELNFTNGDSEYHLIKDFVRKTCSLTSLDGKEKYDEIKTIQSLIDGYLGINSKEVYESTGYIKQEQIAEIKKTGNMMSAIQNSVSSSSDSNHTHQILKSIADEISELQKGLKALAKTPGPIKMYTDKYHTLTEEIRKMKHEWQNLMVESEKQKKNEKRIEEISEQLEKLDEQLANFRKYQEAILTLQNIDSEYKRISEDLNEISNQNTKMTQLEVQLDQYSQFADKNMNEIFGKVTVLNEEVKLRQEAIAKINSDLEQALISSPKFAPMWLLGVGIGIIAFSIIGYFSLQNNLMFVFTAIGALICAFYTVVKFTDPRTKQIQSLTQRKAELTEIIRNDEMKIDKILIETGMESKDQFFLAKETATALLKEKEKTQSAINILLRGRTIDEMKDDQVKLLMGKKEIEVNNLTEHIKRSAMSEDEFIQKDRRSKELKSEERKLQDELMIATTRLKDANLSVEDIQQKEIELEETERELYFHKRRLSILELTKQFVEKATADTIAMVAHILNSDIKKYLPGITNNLYEDVKTDANLEFRVFVKAKNDWISPRDRLSQGTFDQICFLVRLAIFKLVVNDKKPFIILDDPFVTFDNQRLEKTIQLLEELGQTYQILLFTHNESYSKWGNVIEVGK